jgi:hypothetical protein
MNTAEETRKIGADISDGTIIKSFDLVILRRVANMNAFQNGYGKSTGNIRLTIRITDIFS